MKCTRQKENAKNCPCVKLNPSCPRIGNCCLCIRFHKAMGEVPECLKPVVDKIVNKKLKQGDKDTTKGTE